MARLNPDVSKMLDVAFGQGSPVIFAGVTSNFKGAAAQISTTPRATPSADLDFSNL